MTRWITTASRALTLAMLSALSSCSGTHARVGSDAAARHEDDAGLQSDGRATTDTEPLSVVKAFACNAAAMHGTTSVLDVAGDPGADVAIRDVDASCHYTLLYREDGAETELSAQPGGYLIVNASRTSEDTTVVCASNIVHQTDGTGQHAISAVLLECTAKSGGVPFGPLVKLVDGGDDYAAWVGDIVPASAPGKFEVTWFRDFSFQFMNLSEAGRPESDGLYRTRFALGPDGSLQPGETTRIPADQVPVATTHTEWEPTASELQENAAWVHPDEGPCPPPGCPR